MKTTKVLSAIVIGMMIVSGIPLFASGQAANDTLVIALQQDMISMNPWDPDTNDVWKSNQIGWCFEGLMAYNPDYELYPVLAAESATGPNGADAWINGDGTQVSVNLREGVTFHDGVEMTSKDVVFSYQTLAWGLFQTQVLTPLEWPDAQWERYDGGSTTIGIEANGTYRVDFHLATPYAMFWYLTMAVPIMPHHIWNGTDYTHVLNYGDDTVPINDTCEITWDYGYGSDVSEIDATIGTGPLMLESWIKEQGSVITAYEGYWDVDGTTNWAGTEYPNYPQHVTTIRYKIYTQLDVAIMALQNGDVHHLPWSLTPGYYNLLKTDPNIGIEQNKDQGFFYLSYNFRKGAMMDVNFRRAVAYCVDKQYIVDRLMGGYGIQGSVPISVTNQLYVNDTVPAWIAGGDLAAAEALLDDAGYVDADDDGWRDMPDGSPLNYNILTPPKDYDPIRADSGIMIEKNLKSIGLNIAAVPTSFDTIVSAAYVSLDFDMYILGWTVGSFPESYLRDFFHSESNVAVNPAGSNAAGYENASVDAMIDEMDITMDTEDRVQLIKDICGATMYDMPYDTLYYRTNIEAYRQDIWSGWVPAFGTIYNGFSIFNLAPPTDGGEEPAPTVFSGIEARINAPSTAGAGESITGTVVAVDVMVDGETTTKVPSSGATVTIEASYGQTVTATTDTNGVASFTLDVPYQTISSFNVDVNVSKSGAWATFNKTIGVKFTNHIAQLSLSTDDGVIAPGATTTVVATVTDENGDPLSGVDVSVDTALMFGSVDDDTKATNASGAAAFEYTAPDVSMLPNTHRFEQFKASIMVENTIIPEVQSASLIIGISSDLYDWHDLDITTVTDYVLDQTGANYTLVTLELTDQDGTLIEDFPVTVALSEDGILEADAEMKNTDATGKVTFNLTLDAAYTGAGTVIATFNTSKAYSIKDSVALYVKNDPTFTMDMYYLNVTSTADEIWNRDYSAQNTTTLTATLYDDAWAPVEGMDLYMGLSDDSLVEVSAEFVATDANGSASFNITCIANGSADLALVFGIENSIGIFQGYNLMVNKSMAQTSVTLAVANETVFAGPAVAGETGPWFLAHGQIANAQIFKNGVLMTTGFSVLVTGAVTLTDPLVAGDNIDANYNYTTAVANENATFSAAAGAIWLPLNHTSIANAQAFMKNATTGNVYVPLPSAGNYTLNGTTGGLALTYPLAAGDNILVNYNYTTAVVGEHVYGPSVENSRYWHVLANVPAVNAAVKKWNAGVWTNLVAGTDYTINLVNGNITYLNKLATGDKVYVWYNYTVNTPNHILTATASTYIIDNNPFGDATPDNSTITVLVTDDNGNPLAGKNVTAIAWTSPTHADILLDSQYQVTDATGHATFVVTANTNIGGSQAVYFQLNDTIGMLESVTVYIAPYTPGYAADIDFDLVADHNSAVDITATVYEADGSIAPNVRCQFFIPPTAEGIPGVFQGGDDWGWTEYGDYIWNANGTEYPEGLDEALMDGIVDEEWNMADYAGYLGSWFENNQTYTDVNGQLVATIDTASFIADAAIPLYFGVGGTGVAAPFNYSANNFWMEYYPEYNPPLTDGLPGGVYYWVEADFTMIDQAILLRAPMATLTEVSMSSVFLSEADNTSTVSLTFQDLDGPLDAVTVNFGEGTAKPTILDEAATSAAGVYTYEYTATPGDFDAGLGFTTVVTAADYAKFPFNFYLPYLAGGIVGQTFVVTIVPADYALTAGDNVTLDVLVTDEYGRLVSGALVDAGTIDATTDAAGEAQLVIPTTTATAAGMFDVTVDVTKGTIATEESSSVILEAAIVEPEMVDIIVGPVLDADDEPISGALVTVSLGTRQAANYTGTTNTTGYATISVPATFLGQSVSITITKDGYETLTYTTTLNADGTLAAAPETFEAEDDGGGISMMLIAIIVIVIVVVVVVVLVVLPKMKGGKGAEPAAPKEAPAEKPKETPKPAEAPAKPEEPKADE